MINTGRTSQQIQKISISPQNGHKGKMPRSSSLEKATTSGRQMIREKKLALLEDVGRLEKKLQDEENVHRALERAFNRPLGSLPRLPPYLPPNTQDLLAEIAVLEEEVVRLEEQVVTCRQILYKEAIYICSKRKLEKPVDYYEQILSRVSKEEQSGRPKSPVSVVRVPSTSSEIVSDRSSLSADNQTEQSSSNLTKEKRVSHESTSVVNSGENEKVKGNQTRYSSSSKQNTDMAFHVTEGSSCYMMNGKQAMDEVNSTADSWENRKGKGSLTCSASNQNLDSVSHLRKPASNDQSSSMRSSYKNRKEKYGNFMFISNKDVQLSERKRPPTQMSGDSCMKETENKALGGDSEPNKVSEDILKCLCSIFIRMSTNDKGSQIDMLPFSLSLVSSQIEKEMEIQDPYGTCAEFKDRDIGPYKDLCIVDAKSIDLKRKKNARFLLHRLKLLLGKLARVELNCLTHLQKVAFWINTYNSCLMNVVLEHGIPDSPEKVESLMHEATIVVAGQTLSAITIEHSILRLPFHLKQGGKKARGVERKASEMFGLELEEPLVIFALSCGSWSSPAVRVYMASQVESELETARREYLQAAVGISKNNKLIIPKLVEWCELDFVNNLEDWVCLHLPDQLRKEALICIQGKGKKPLSELIQFVPYDFTFRFILLP